MLYFPHDMHDFYRSHTGMAIHVKQQRIHSIRQLAHKEPDQGTVDAGVNVTINKSEQFISLKATI